MQGFRDTGVQGYRDTGIQGFGDSGIQGYRDTFSFCNTTGIFPKFHKVSRVELHSGVVNSRVSKTHQNPTFHPRAVMPPWPRGGIEEPRPV